MTAADHQEARTLIEQWQEVLLDEQANARAALPVMENDPRLNFRYGGDHSFEDGPTMIRAKLDLIAHEIAAYLPTLMKKHASSSLD